MGIANRAKKTVDKTLKGVGKELRRGEQKVSKTLRNVGQRVAGKVGKAGVFIGQAAKTIQIGKRILDVANISGVLEDGRTVRIWLKAGREVGKPINIQLPTVTEAAQLYNRIAQVLSVTKLL